MLALLTACAPGSSRPRPTISYTPVPEAELYRRIAALPHVMDVVIGYQDDFPNGRRYNGHIITDDQENPYLVLDQAIAILRQGVPQASIVVHVEFPGPYGRLQFVPNTSDFPGDLGQRYGPQPGSGVPPTSPPVPTPTNWTPPSQRRITQPAA